MKPCEAWAERLVDHLYGEADAATAAHVEQCRECAGELDRLRLLMGALRADEAYPREGDVDWSRFTRETVRRAREAQAAGLGIRLASAARWMLGLPERGGTRAAAWRPARLAWSAAAVLVAGAGVTMMMLSTPDTTTPGGEGAVITAAAAPVAMPEANIDNLSVTLARQNTARYLNETRSVLVTLLDLEIDCDKDKVDVSVERAKATELLRRQRLIAAELNRVPLARASDVCNELERLLVEISTLADCTRSDELMTLRDVVEKRQILVRMELLSAELERRGASSA